MLTILMIAFDYFFKEGASNHLVSINHNKLPFTTSEMLVTQFLFVWPSLLKRD